ncbi:hypothetical protein [Streptomyces sp. NPDC020917]|uniref:hypothetical protein n=1 Tax=Streptomyces sp. NPDC020917 TaxID=3365102 RepID=UPI0037AD41D6
MGSPSEDATVIRYGKRRFLGFLIVVPLVGLTGTASVAMGMGAADDPVLWVFSTVFGLLCVGILVNLVLRWRRRNVVLAFDATGFWWTDGGRSALVEWNALAAVALYCYPRGSVMVVGTLELCPRGEIDPDDPLLWRTVRDVDPPQPGLARLRYRIPMEGVPHPDEVCERWVPRDLWLGRMTQRPGYEGSPDFEGHDQRMRERREGTR